MDKLKMHSPDLSQDNIAKLRELFPGCVTEARDEATGQIRLAVDFDQLKQELSDHIVDGAQERYRLDWPGKRNALLLSNTVIKKALRPFRQESVNFDNTQNLFIEGDNLEVLKLLQDNYLGKIRVIYIDPPYNTGSDLIYKDNFSIDCGTFLHQSQQKDEMNNLLLANPKTNGRFHSDWLSMIYPRLRVARNLLSDDGVIFISIDNNEISELKAICDEIFGAQNLVGIFKWNKTSKAPTLSRKIREKFEYVLCYEKGFLTELKGPDSYNEAAPLFNSGNPVKKIQFPEGSVEFLFSDGVYTKGSYGKAGKVVTLHEDLEVRNQKNTQAFTMSARFKWSQETALFIIPATAFRPRPASDRVAWAGVAGGVAVAAAEAREGGA
ncbi:MAG: site-specific DNA-methyltransferase, partial [Thiocapsa sp. C3-sup]